MSDLFSPATIGSIETKNRIYMAPLTRSRAHNDTDIPSDLAIEYYAPRASAGLIIAEATQISKMGKGYDMTPGIYSDEQVSKWKEITDAVHEKGGKIFLQLWHVGRISHKDVLPDGKEPLAPSAIKADTKVFVDGEQIPASKPKAMSLDEIKQTVKDFGIAAENAKKAGFDGVEIHGANGYLLDQFFKDKTNKRDDEYGGSIENRTRILREVIESFLDVFEPSQVGIRLSPTGNFNDISDSDPEATFSYVIDILNENKLGYLHIVERFPGMDVSNMDLKILENLRAKWDGFYIANGDYDLTKATDAVKSGHADAITFGRPFIANPDLPKRLELGAPLNEPDQETFYGGGAEGYTDYPFLEEMDKEEAA